MSVYSKETLYMLKDIYTYRCLTIKQSYTRYHQQTGMSLKEYVDVIIKPLINQGLIELVKFNDNMAIFITNKGIDLLKTKFNLVSDIYDVNTGKVVKGYQTAAKLKMLPKLINHQVHLNQFVFELKDAVIKDGSYNIKDKPFEYFDEKFMSKYTCIRPDGMIQLQGVDLFLEMDMSTENLNQLTNKWNNYRMFLKSIEYRQNKNKIIILFIIANTTKVQERINLVRKTLTDTLVDFFDDKIDIYIGTKDFIFNYLFNKLIPQINNSYFLENYILSDLLKSKHGFYPIPTSSLPNQFNNIDYGNYIRKINRNNKIPIENGKIQEFIFQEALYEPMSLIYKISYLSRNTSMFYHQRKREIDYIILVENEKTIFNDLKVSEILGLEHIMFTTKKRLESMPFYEAIFTIGQSGIVRHFKDSGFKIQEFEFNLNDI